MLPFYLSKSSVGLFTLTWTVVSGKLKARSLRSQADSGTFSLDEGFFFNNTSIFIYQIHSIIYHSSRRTRIRITLEIRVPFELSIKLI